MFVQRLTLVFLAAFALPSAAAACGIEGRATRTDGSKVEGTVTVSTSWNSSKAFPRGGSYSLDLGSSACGQSFEVFVNGYSIGRRTAPSSGNATV